MNSEGNSTLLLDQENNESVLKSHWTARAFKKMEKGSLRGSTFVLIMTALGTGIFTLHHVLSGCGIVFGLLLIISVALLFFYSSCILIYAKKEFENLKTFSELNDKLGAKSYNVFFKFFSIFFLFLMGLSNILAASKTFYFNFENIIWSIFKIKAENQNVDYFNFYFVWFIGFIVFLIVVKKDLTSLSYISMFSFVFYLVLIFITIIQLPMYMKDLSKSKTNEYNFFSCSFDKLLTSFGLLVASFNCLANFFSIANNMQNSTEKRTNKIFKRTFLLLAILYSIVSLVSYLSLGEKSKDADLFIFRDKIGDSDYSIVIARVFLDFSIILGASLNLHPIKVIVFEGKTISNIQNFLFSILIVVLPVLGAALFNNVTNYMSIGGTFSGVFIGFFFPGIIAIKIGYAKSFLHKCFLYFFAYGLTLIGLIGTVYGIINFNN